MLKTVLVFYLVLLITTLKHDQTHNWRAPYLDYLTNPTTLQFKGYWGNFGDIIYPDAEWQYGCGAQIRFAIPWRKGYADELGAIGLRIKYCDSTQWQAQDTKQISGQAGIWKGMKMCPEDSFIMGFQVRWQDYQGGAGDDSALNGLKIFCRNPYDIRNPPQIQEVMVHEGLQGDWKPVHSDKTKFMKGFNIQYQKILNQDNTCMNGLTFQLYTFQVYRFVEMKIKDECRIPMQRVSKS